MDFRKSGCDEGRHYVAISPPPQNRLANDLSAEAIEGLALSLERVDHVHRGDSLAASVLGVGDRITDNVLEEDLEHAAGLLVDMTGDALDATTAIKTADDRLVIALGAVLSEALTSFSATRNDESLELLARTKTMTTAL